jgi:ABC-type Fe3+-hydroxamate transport system substrate-binding protein
VNSGPAVDGSTQRLTDGIGREVNLAKKIDRVVSLAPSLTEIIFSSGGGNKLVGDTTYCNFPKEAVSIEKVGDTQTPNIEKIVALKPQVVFVSTASQLEAFTKLLNDQNIAIFVIDVKTLGDVPKAIRLMGKLLNTQEAANASAADLDRRIETVSKANLDPQKKPVRVFLQISNEPLFTIGTGSFLTDLVRVAGGESVTANVETAYPQLSKETAAALDPDAIILSDSEDNREPNIAFKNSSAVKSGRVFKINADIISRPGPRLVDALEQIAGYLNFNADNK